MSVIVRCPDCENKLKVKDASPGKKIRCPACSTVFSAPAKANDDDFQDDMPVGRRKSRSTDDFDDDDNELYAPKARGKKPVKKKSARRGKSASSKGAVYGLLGGGVAVVVIVVGIVAMVASFQARKGGFNQAAIADHWKTFRHPMGVAQIDMPGDPRFNASQSVNGTQTYSLTLRKFQMSLTAIQLPAGTTSNPATVDLIFNELQTKTPQQVPGARLISANRLSTGFSPGLEMKLAVNGEINVSRFYAVDGALIGAEFITRNESAVTAEREQFFNSMRGPNGNLLNINPQEPADSSPSVTGQPTGSVASASITAPNGPSLAAARRGVQTDLRRKEKSGQPIPDPPSGLAMKVRYDAPSGKQTAYVTTIPQDGQKHPAIVWISGGDCNSIDDGFFQESPPNNDQTASAFRKAGIVTMYPSLRGGNDNPGFKEAFYGEVDDVIAAADFLSKLDGVDPGRIYLGGHSTGGTLAFLVAASTNRFRAVFSFGPVEDIRGYGSEFTPFNTRNSKEFDLRTPLKWVDSIQSRTFVLEGMRRPGNASSLTTLSKASHNSNVSFLAVQNANHFNILAPATRLIADKILRDVGPATNIAINEGELNLNYAP